MFIWTIHDAIGIGLAVISLLWIGGWFLFLSISDWWRRRKLKKGKK